MMQISVRVEGSMYVTVVHNPATGYKFMDDTYPMDEQGEGLRKAVASASDWVEKFKQAGIQAMVMTEEIPQQVEVRRPRRPRRERDEDEAA